MLLRSVRPFLWPLFLLLQAVCGSRKALTLRRYHDSSKESSAPKKPRLRAAVVLTGSARSYVFPLVHESIKANLIDALKADVDVFIRTTTEDNLHGRGIGAAGVHIQSSEEKMRDLKSKLAILKPVKIVYTTLASEDAEKNVTFTSNLHRIYRQFDPRRYSMFFNRHQVYRMARDYEEEHGFKYDWFVHARLDCGWVGPVEPLHRYASTVVWVPAQWIVEIPDTFALVPAQYKDAYFDIDQKLQPKGDIYCLGGPDFNKKYCEKKYLLANTELSKEDAATVVSSCCDSSTGRNGFSESFLAGTLRKNFAPYIPAPFYTFIFRDSEPDVFCAYFHPQNTWQLMNVAPRWIEQNLSGVQHWVRSYAAMIGCEVMAAPEVCNVTVSKRNVATMEGKTTEVKTMQTYDCPAREGITNFVPALLRLAGTDLCVTVQPTVPAQWKPRSMTELKSVGKLLLKECAGVQAKKSPPSHGDRAQYFMLHSHRVRSVALKGWQTVGVCVGEGGDVVAGGCASDEKRFRLDFEYDQSNAVFCKTSTRGSKPNTTAVKSSGSSGRDVMCLTASTSQQEVTFMNCAADGAELKGRQQFEITSAGDASVMDMPALSPFTWDSGFTGDCCNNATTECCNEQEDERLRLYTYSPEAQAKVSG